VTFLKKVHHGDKNAELGDAYLLCYIDQLYSFDFL